MQESRVRRKAKRFFFQLVKGRVQNRPPVVPNDECRKLDKPIQVRSEQVSYHSADCRRTSSIRPKVSIMSDFTHPSKIRKGQAQQNSRSLMEKLSTYLPCPSALPPLLRCRIVPTGDLTCVTTDGVYSGIGPACVGSTRAGLLFRWCLCAKPAS